MSTPSIKIDAGSLKGVLHALDKLPRELQRSAERAVLRAGVAPIRKAINARVPVDTGNLKKSIGVKVNLGRGTGYGEAQAGPRSGAKFRSKKNNKTGRRAKNKKGKAIGAEEYAWYLETGTPKMAARPFIRPAVDDAQSEVLTAMTSGFDKHLTKVAARLASKSK